MGGQVLSRIPLKLPHPSLMFGLLALVAAFGIGRYTSHRTQQAVEVADEQEAPAKGPTKSGVPFPNAAPASSALAELTPSEDLPTPPATPPRPRGAAPSKSDPPAPARPRPLPRQAATSPPETVAAAASAPPIPIPEGCLGGLPRATARAVLLDPDRFAAGMPVVFKNSMSRAVYVELFDPQTGERSGSAVILAGASVSMPVVGDSALANVSVGSQWCSPEIGWVDPKVTRIRPAVVAANGSIRMDIALQSTSTSGWPISLKVDHVLPKKLALQPSQSEIAYAAMPYEARLVPMIIPGVTPNFKSALRQNDSIAGVGRTYATPMHAEQIERDQHSRLPSMDYVGMPLAEWKLSRNGALDYVAGQIGSTDIQFVVDLRSPMSAIPSSLARQLGIVECMKGQWFIGGLYRKACAVQVPSLNIGGTDLNNVWIAYADDIVHPILGRNVLGAARYKRGADGTYLALGPR